MAVRLTWTIGDVLRKLRKRRRLGIEALAAATKLDKNTIGRVERDATNPDLATVTALARALGVSVAELHAAVPLTVDLRMRAVLDRYWTLDPAAQRAFLLLMEHGVEKALHDPGPVQ